MRVKCSQRWSRAPARRSVVAIARIPLRRFIETAREPFLIAFSTASSEAALPKALENLERFGVPKHIAAFVLPAGYSFNLDGSTLYLETSARQIVDILKNARQPMLAICLTDTVRQVRAVIRSGKKSSAFAPSMSRSLRKMKKAS